VWPGEHFKATVVYFSCSHGGFCLQLRTRFAECGIKKSQRAKQKCCVQQALFGTKFMKFDPKRANQTTLYASIRSGLPYIVAEMSSVSMVSSQKVSLGQMCKIVILFSSTSPLAEQLRPVKWNERFLPV